MMQPQTVYAAPMAAPGMAYASSSPGFVAAPPATYAAAQVTYAAAPVMIQGGPYGAPGAAPGMAYQPYGMRPVVRSQPKKVRQPKPVADTAEIVQKSLGLFDVVAPGGACRPAEFQMLIQRAAVDALKAGCPQDNSPMTQAIEQAIDALDTGSFGHVVDLLFGVIDTDQNGLLERAEFEAFMMNLSRGEVADYFFNLVDVNRNGAISLEEAQNLAGIMMEIFVNFVSLATNAAEVVLQSNAFAQMFESEVLGQVPFFQQTDTNKPGSMSWAQVESFLPMVQQMVPMLINDPTARMQGEMFAKSMAFINEQLPAALFENTEWMDNGVDEATWLATMVPMARELWAQNTNNLQENLQKQQEMCASMPPESAAMCGPMMAILPSVIGAMSENAEDIQAVFQIAQERASEHIPEVCRIMYKFLDFNNDGVVSSRELHAAADLMASMKNYMLALQTSDVELANESVVDAITAGFVMVDRNANGAIEADEITGFVVKAGTCATAFIRVYSKIMFKCFLSEAVKVAITKAWTQQGLTEVKKEDIMAMLSMGPLMMGGAMGGLAGPSQRMPVGRSVPPTQVLVAPGQPRPVMYAAPPGAPARALAAPRVVAASQTRLVAGAPPASFRAAPTYATPTYASQSYAATPGVAAAPTYRAAPTYAAAPVTYQTAGFARR